MKNIPKSITYLQSNRISLLFKSFKFFKIISYYPAHHTTKSMLAGKSVIYPWKTEQRYILQQHFKYEQYT